jgi:mRNA-degrading endonuclease RelE of RelBE toxin-antitoxin system
MDLQQRLREKIEHLLTAPVPHDAKHYHQLPGKVFRVRVGDYRIVYELVPAKETILILIIDKRSRVYD